MAQRTQDTHTKFWSVNLKGINPLGKSWGRWPNIYQQVLKNVWDAKWIELAQDVAQWQALVNSEMNFRVTGSQFTSLVTENITGTIKPTSLIQLQIKSWAPVKKKHIFETSPSRVHFTHLMHSVTQVIFCVSVWCTRCLGNTISHGFLHNIAVCRWDTPVYTAPSPPTQMASGTWFSSVW